MAKVASRVLRVAVLLGAGMLVASLSSCLSNDAVDQEETDKSLRYKLVLNACLESESPSVALQYFSHDFLLEPLQIIVDQEKVEDVELEIERVKLLVGSCLRIDDVSEIRFLDNADGPTLVVDFNDAFAGEMQRYSFVFVDSEDHGPKIDGLIFDLDPN